MYDIMTIEREKKHLPDAYLEKSHQIVVWDEWNTELNRPQDETEMSISWIEKSKLLARKRHIAVGSNKCSLLARCKRRKVWRYQR